MEGFLSDSLTAGNRCLGQGFGPCDVSSTYREALTQRGPRAAQGGGGELRAAAQKHRPQHAHNPFLRCPTAGHPAHPPAWAHAFVCRHTLRGTHR
jgi:hypothetical protein